VNGFRGYEEEGLSYDIHIPESPEGYIELYRIDVESEYRWRGVATRFMKYLCAFADQNNFAIELEVGSGTDDENIIHDLPLWYWGFGFRWAGGWMRREPNTGG